MPRVARSAAIEWGATARSAATKESRPVLERANLVDLYGRGEKIRTSDPLHPMQVRYQAALRPDANEQL